MTNLPPAQVPPGTNPRCPRCDQPAEMLDELASAAGTLAARLEPDTKENIE